MEVIGLQLNKFKLILVFMVLSGKILVFDGVSPTPNQNESALLGCK